MHLCSKYPDKKCRKFNANENEFYEIIKSKILLVMNTLSGMRYFSYLTNFSYFTLKKNPKVAEHGLNR
jgi:hypothetical protein